MKWKQRPTSLTQTVTNPKSINQVGYVSYTPHNPYLLCPRSNLTRSSISVTCASPSCASFGSSPFPYTKSRSNSLRSCYRMVALDIFNLIMNPIFQSRFNVYKMQNTNIRRQRFCHFL